MPVPVNVLTAALHEVKILYAEDCDLARKNNCRKKKFNLLIRPVVAKMDLSDEDKADLITELAKTYGRRGGKKKPRKKRSKKQKPPKMLKEEVAARRRAKKFGLKPVRWYLLPARDLKRTAEQAHLDTCPID